MAILDKVEVTISSNGSVLQEYAVPIDNHPVIVNEDGTSSTARKSFKYIEAMPGANFQINYSISEGQDPSTAFYFGFRTHIDGQRVLSPLIPAHEYKVTKRFSQTRSGSQTGSGATWKEELYYWRELLTVDEEPTEPFADMRAKYAKIGIIQIDFLRRGYPTTIKRQWTTGGVVGEAAIPEKALKGQPIDLGTGLREAKVAPSGTVWNGESIDDGPYSTFTFLYRSKTALQILGALPRTPSPALLEDRDPETLNREQLVELARRQQAQRETEKAKIKSESTNADFRHFASVVKREMLFEDSEELSIIPQPRKRIRQEMELIDLTDD